MNERLKYKEFVPIGESLQLGEQVNIDHDNCDAGYDTKRRLYIKRCDDGTILGYCQHCGNSGCSRQSYNKAKQAREVAKTQHRGSNVDYASRIKDNSRADWEGWDIRGVGWCSKYGITESETRRYGIGYYPDEERIAIPIQAKGLVKGYQLRSLDPDDTPKYSTICTSKPMFWYDGALTGKLVIVEDVLSAIKCRRYTSSLAILSSDMSDEVLEFISRTGHDDFIIFLDDDNKHVRLNQRELRDRLSLLGNVKVIKGLGKDPKELTDSELMGILL